MILPSCISRAIFSEAEESVKSYKIVGQTYTHTR